MSSGTLHHSNVPPGPRGTERQSASPRAHALADRLERGASLLMAVVEALTEAQWQAPLPRDGRKIGVVVHHVASAYPVEIELAQVIASGRAIAGLTMDDIHAINAAHAYGHPGVRKAEALDLIRRNSSAAAAVIRALSDEELDRAAPASLHCDAPLTCQFVLEDHAVRHSYHHLAGLRRAWLA
jgi:hypothetical protein